MEGLRARGLRRAFDGRVVVEGVDLDVAPGEVVGLLGPNGAGKSTCFRILAGLDNGGAGEVALDGKDLAGLPLWKRVRAGLGYLPQEPSVFRGLTLSDNLRVPLEVRGRLDQLDALLVRFRLADRAKQLAGSLSGGERRRLEVARAMASAPRVLLLDEPFAGVDPVVVEELQHLIVSLAREGVGVLLTDHAVREALGICVRALIVDGGVVIAHGTPEEVAQNPRVVARYLGHSLARGVKGLGPSGESDKSQ